MSDINSIGDPAGGCKCKANLVLNPANGKCVTCYELDRNSINDGSGGCKCHPNYNGTV